MPVITLSTHALYQLTERGISRHAVTQAVQRPDRVTKQLNHRFKAVKMVAINGKRLLLVVIYDHKNTTIEVVTAFLTSKFKKYL